jgi:cell wall-associated NlpC family hydrolase
METRDMHPYSSAIVAAARACIGASFQLQGRGTGGYDCLGVVVAAARGAGVIFDPGANYGLRGTSRDFARGTLMAASCREVALRDALPGDILLSQPAARQVHFAIATELGFVEANAGLRRIVERPRALDDNWDSAWRLPWGEI